MLLRVLVVCLLWSAGAHAGGTDPVLRYRCDPTHDQIVLTYRMESWNDNQTFPVGPDAWTPGQLIEGMVDEDHIGERGVVIRQCRLRDALYTVEIRPEPGNMNIRGQCGGETYTFVAIRREKKPILEQTLDGPCLRTQPITTKIIVSGGGARPQVTAVPPRDFYASSLAAPSP